MRGTRGFPKLFALAPGGAPAGRSMLEPSRDVPASASGERLRRPSGRGRTRAASRPGQLWIHYPIAAVPKQVFPEFLPQPIVGKGRLSGQSSTVITESRRSMASRSTYLRCSSELRGRRTRTSIMRSNSVDTRFRCRRSGSRLGAMVRVSASHAAEVTACSAH
jgi:hypothetical protein